MVQVVAGALLGAVAGRWAAAAPAPSSAASEQIATAFAKRLGAPHLAEQLTQRPESAPPGIAPLVQTACAFGNSLTLPLLYLLTLFPAAADAAQVAGFTALILLGWSPLFWTFGYARLTRAVTPHEEKYEGSGAGTVPYALPSSGVLRDVASARPFSEVQAGRGQDGSQDSAPDRSSTSSRDSSCDADASLNGVIVPELLPAEMADLPPSKHLAGSGQNTDDAVPSKAGSNDNGNAAETAGAAIVPAQEAALAASGASRRPDATAPLRRLGMTQIAPGNAMPNVELPLLRGRRNSARPHGRRWRERVMHAAGDSIASNRAPGRWQRWWGTCSGTLQRVANPPIVAALGGLLLGFSPLGVQLDQLHDPFALWSSRKLDIGCACCDQAAAIIIQMRSGSLQTCMCAHCSSHSELGSGAACHPVRHPRGAGGALFLPESARVVDLVRRLPWELHLSLGAARSVAEVATLLGSATLVVQAITLGASLLPRDAQRGARALLVPQSRWEWRQLVATGVVRLLLMPLVGLATVGGLAQWGLLPPGPACRMALLVQSCMPSAQNLVLLVHLRPETRPLAPLIAQLLFRQYLLALVPTTIWISIFLAVAG